MKIHEVTSLSSGSDLFTFSVTLNPQRADHIRHLVQDVTGVTILGVKVIDDDRVELTAGCRDEDVRNRLRDAW
jgi:hypothetical protein